MGVLTRKQFQQQLIDIKTREQGGAACGGHSAGPLRTAQGMHFTGFVQWGLAQQHGDALKGHEHGAQLRKGALGALGRNHHTASFAGEKLDDQTRFAPGVAVQHIGRQGAGGGCTPVAHVLLTSCSLLAQSARGASSSVLTRNHRHASGFRRQPIPNARPPTTQEKRARPSGVQVLVGLRCQCVSSVRRLHQ